MFGFRFRCVALVLLFCSAVPLLVAQDISGLQRFDISPINLNLSESQANFNGENADINSVLSGSIPKTFSGVNQSKIWSTDTGVSQMASAGGSQQPEQPRQTQRSRGGVPTWLIVVGVVVGGILLTAGIMSLLAY